MLHSTLQAVRRKSEKGTTDQFRAVLKKPSCT